MVPLPQRSPGKRLGTERSPDSTVVCVGLSSHPALKWGSQGWSGCGVWPLGSSQLRQSLGGAP